MKDYKCEYEDCSNEAIGWGLLEKTAGEYSIDPKMPTATMAPLCAEHMSKK